MLLNFIFKHHLLNLNFLKYLEVNGILLFSSLCIHILYVLIKTNRFSPHSGMVHPLMKTETVLPRSIPNIL